MKFSATLKTTKEFKTAISSIQAFIEEATFVVNKDGIKFRGLEPSHVRYLEVIFPADKFIKFNVDDELKFTIKPNDFLEVVKRAKEGDEITIEVQKENSPLDIHIEGKKHFTLSLISIEHDAPVPNFKFQSKIIMTYTNFSDYVKDIAVVSDNFMMEIKENKMKLSGKGERGKVEVEAEGNITQLEGTIKSEFAIQFLVEAIKTFGTAFETITLETGNNMPLRLTLESPDMGSIQYVQAHKELS